MINFFQSTKTKKIIFEGLKIRLLKEKWETKNLINPIKNIKFDMIYLLIINFFSAWCDLFKNLAWLTSLSKVYFFFFWRLFQLRKSFFFI